jgi:uncharacterized membrane protein YuzA (DUF378 family)
MWATLLAVRGTWVGIFFVLIGVAALWLVVRAIIDLARWFNEEILEDYRQRKNKRRGPSDPER